MAIASIPRSKTNAFDTTEARDLARLLGERDDALTALEARFEALTAKMDVDFAAQNVAVADSQLDVNYSSL